MTTPLIRRRGVQAGVGALALVLLAGLALWYFFLRDTSEPAFTIDDATEAAQGPADATDAAEPGDEGIEGGWTVDQTFVSEEGTRSEAGYRVAEVLRVAGQEQSNIVVGRTAEVTGTIVIEGTRVTDVQISVDMASVATDESRRDGRYRSALDVDQFPTADFVLTEPIDLGDLPSEGETISVIATGDLTVHGVTQPAEVEIDGALVAGRLVVVGRVPVVFADFGVDAPTAPVVVSIEDQGLIEFQLFLARS